MGARLGRVTSVGGAARCGASSVSGWHSVRRRIARGAGAGGAADHRRRAAAGGDRQARLTRLRDPHRCVRAVRRTAPAQAVPALLQRWRSTPMATCAIRALVLLTGFNDPRTRDAMRESLASPNDRLRTVAYSFFEHNPDRAHGPELLAALDKEQAEFVRPALVRALAAHGADPRVRET